MLRLAKPLVLALCIVCVIGVTVPSCGCVAKEQGWTVDCSKPEVVTSALAYLRANNCGSAATCQDASNECRRNYFILNAHHDYCPESALPEEAEDGLHEFEAFCEQCTIQRIFDQALPVCARPQCSDPTPVLTAFEALQSNNCQQMCGSAVCGDNYKIVRAYHDLCAENEVPETVEEGIHDFETACEAQSCNAALGTFDPNTCLVTPATSPTIGTTFVDDEAVSTSSPAPGSGSGRSSSEVASIVLGVLLAVSLVALAILAVVFASSRTGKTRSPLEGPESDLESAVRESTVAL